MADTKISALSAISAAAGAQELPVNDAGTSKKATLTQIKAWLFGEDLALLGDISPAQLTADQNDWSPTGLSTATVIRVSTDQGSRTITGLAGGSDGRLMAVVNVGTGYDSELVLSAENASSTAGNRFALPADLVLAPGDGVLLQYDSTDSRWRSLGVQRISERTGRRRAPTFATDCLSTDVDTFNEYLATAISTGTLNAASAGLVTKDHPGVVRLRSSTTANSGVRIVTDAAMLLLGGGEVFECVFNLTTLTNGTFRLGFHDCTTSADAVDGAYIEIPSTGNAVLKTSSNSTRTTSATIATLSTGTWYTALIVVNKDASAVDAFLFDANGNQLGTAQNTTNIPTASGRECGAGIIGTNSGTTATDLWHIDYISTGFTKALSR